MMECRGRETLLGGSEGEGEGSSIAGGAVGVCGLVCIDCIINNKNSMIYSNSIIILYYY